jgi:hypothetical protein
VAGGLAHAKKADITILVGGEKEIFEVHLPMLQVIGGKILHMGPLGGASVVKVITNLYPGQNSVWRRQKRPLSTASILESHLALWVGTSIVFEKSFYKQSK